MKQTVKRIIKKVDKKFNLGIYTDPDEITLKQLKELSDGCEAYIQQHKIQSTIKILWPTPFTLDKMWWAHDGILINALRIRGAEIIPTMCDQIQKDECVFYSGKWQEYEQNVFKVTRESTCNTCVKRDNTFWSSLRLNPIKLASYISSDERREFSNKASDIVKTNWKEFSEEGYPVGFEAWKAVVNNDLQAEISEVWRDRAEQLAKSHIFNIFALQKAYSRVFQSYKPDCVFGNGGFYYFWGIVENYAIQHQVPYYRYYPVGLQPLCWNYAKNSAKNVYLDEAWDSWIQQDWDKSKTTRVHADLKERGLDLNLSLDKVNTIKNHVITRFNLNPDKPIILLLTGVIWDANTNVPSKIFKDMYDWLFKTIEWAANKPNCQFIIRVHPSENYVPAIAKDTRTLFLNELSKSNISVPDNVKIIKSEESVNTYDLMLASDMAVTYASTSGLEYACLGKPIIVLSDCHYTHKSFTVQPENVEDYFCYIANFQKNSPTAQHFLDTALLAIRYWYLYAFHGSMLTGHMWANYKNYSDLKRGIDGVSAMMKPITYKDILPGANEYIDYICDSVLSGLPIFGEDRWPPDNKIGI